jgi:hypothetical protein
MGAGGAVVGMAARGHRREVLGVHAARAAAPSAADGLRGLYARLAERYCTNTQPVTFI